MSIECTVQVIEGVIHIDGKALVDGSIVRDLVILENLDIEFLPERVIFLGELQIIGCPNLTKLPSRLVVADGLNVENCPNLQSIGAETYVGVYLSIEVCPKLNSIPEDLVVDGELAVTNCGEFEPFKMGMNQATTFVTEKFRLESDRIIFYDEFPETLMQSVVGNTLRSFFDIPMIQSFPQMDRTIVAFGLGSTSGYPTARMV